MIETVTYRSINAKPSEAWIAYVVLPTGEYWLVRCTGATEEIAKTKAIALYEREAAKAPVIIPDEDNPWAQAASGRGAHFAGKVWLIHKETREKIRVPSEQVDGYLKDYERGGPRSK